MVFEEEEEKGCHPGEVSRALWLVKQVERGQVFEAPEAVTQEKVSVF